MYFKIKNLFIFIKKFHQYLPVDEELVDVENIRDKLIDFLMEIILMIDNKTFDSKLSSLVISKIDSEYDMIKLVLMN